MPGPDNQSANWRYNGTSGLGGGDLLADEVGRLNLGSDVSAGGVSAKALSSTSPKPESHSRTPSSGAGRSSILDGKDQPIYPSLANIQRGSAQKQPQGPPANGRGGRPNGFGSRNNPNLNFRPPQQIQVGLPGQSLIPSPTSLGYSVGSPQQLYEMMEQRAPPNTSIRPNHQSNGSDAESQAMQGFPGPMFSPQLAGALSMYPNQFYSNQEAYRADLAAQAQAMLVARLQQQQYGQYPGSPPVTGSTEGGSMASPASAASSSGNGPSANNRKLGLYKTELCRSWEEKHTCRYGAKCQFAHGEDELRNVSRHPKYKTEICRTFWVSGSCPYGKRCCFIHTELPNGANPNAQGQASAGLDATSPTADGRPRSESNTSDPENNSLLERISTASLANQPTTTDSGTPTPVDSNSGYPSRPSLTLSTNLDKTFKTQNKSAFPFLPNAAGRGSVQPATAKSPIPVTAGPDFGRHTASRNEIVGHNTRNGASTPTGGHSYSNSIEDGNSSNHQRTASNGVWRMTSPAGEANISSPWTTQELATGGRSQRPW